MKTRIATLFFRYLSRRLVPKQPESIEIRTFSATDVGEILTDALADWTAIVDEQLRKYRRGSPPYIRLMKVRMMTFAEYQTLFKPRMPEEEYRYYRPFEWMRCATETRRKLLLTHKNPDEESD